MFITTFRLALVLIFSSISWSQATTGGSGIPIQGSATAASSSNGGSAPSVSFTAVPNVVFSGGSSLLSWTVTGASSQFIDQGIGAVAATGSLTVNPTSTTTYTLTAIGAGGTRGIPVTVAVTPLPTATFTCSNLSPAQGSTITCTYSSSNVLTCDISGGILAPGTTVCTGTTAAFAPPFIFPGPTTTVYTFTAHNANGDTAISQTVSVSATTFSGDDSRYCLSNETTSFPGSVTVDGPATLPVVCNYTPISATPSPGTVHTVGYAPGSPGTQTCGTASADWDTAISTLACGDVVKLAQGCSKQCAGSTGCLLPLGLHCNSTHWILFEAVDATTGLPDAGFPVEGQRISPCDIGLAWSNTSGYPDYSADCTARGGPKVRTFKITSPSATTPALAVYSTGASNPTCTNANFPCVSYFRFQGLELTTVAGTRTSHKLLELDGADHMIADRNVIHGQNDPLFRIETQGGIGMNGTYMSAINNWIYDVFCANAPSGSTCVDSQAISWGVTAFPQVSHKVVNNFMASAGETVFSGGGAEGFFPTATNPDGATSDAEVRRNWHFKPLTWMLPYKSPTINLTSVDTTGVFTGTVPGGTANALVGRTFSIAGFVNVGNNIKNALVTASSAFTLTFVATTVAEAHAATAAENPPHWDTKNDGESKSGVRDLWEGNVCSNSWMGWQSDQFGNCHLFTPKNQSSKLAIGAGNVITGANVSGTFYMNCINGAGTCSAAGKPQFVCSQDPGALPDWTGVGTTIASCGDMVAFPCSAGTAQIGPFTLTSVNSSGVYTGTITGGGANAYVGWAVKIAGFTNSANGSTAAPSIGVITASTTTTFTIAKTTVTESAAATATAIQNPSCPGAYIKNCQSAGDANRCAVLIGTLNTGIYYHIMAVVSPDQVQVVEDPTSVVAAVPTMYKRGLNPFAVVRNFTDRYELIYHVTQGMEVSSGADDGGAEALGVHNVSIHDIAVADQTSSFWDNNNSCCNVGAFVKMVSGVSVAAAVPNNLQFAHITDPLVGFSSSAISGATALLDVRCKLPLSGLVCANAIVPMYSSNFTFRDSIISASLHLIPGSSTFPINTQKFGLDFYGSPAHDGISPTYNVQKNLLPTTIWSGQTNQLPNLHLLGTNTVEACSCTTAANGGNCTPGSPNTWSSPVTTGSRDACDRATTWASTFNNYDPNGGPATDLQLPSGSPYRGQASDGGDLGANVPTIYSYTAGVTLPISYPVLTIDGYWGNTTCTFPCALPAAVAGTYYTQTLHSSIGASPYKRWTVVSGTLPSGLTMALGTGVISGTPTVAGASSISVQEEDAGHQKDTKNFTLQVN